MKDAGRNITKIAAMAKLSASETATFVAHQSIQVSRLLTQPPNLFDWFELDSFVEHNASENVV